MSSAIQFIDIHVSVLYFLLALSAHNATDNVCGVFILFVVGVPQDIPYLSLDASRLSFHGHVHNVDVLVATPGVMATRTVKVLTDGASTPKRVSSAAVTFITSIGGGYVDFRSDAGAASGSSGGTGSSSGGQAADRNHIIVWQVG